MFACHGSVRVGLWVEVVLLIINQSVPSLPYEILMSLMSYFHLCMPKYAGNNASTLVPSARDNQGHAINIDAAQRLKSTSHSTPL